MGPSRTSTGKLQNVNGQSGAHKSSRKHGSNSRRHADAHANDASASDIPGVQKLKSALRQTSRLLARDNLAADVRVKTERRLKSLQLDLETAERRRKERTLAKRYHKVKFFERQKVLRRIKRAKKQPSPGDLLSSKEAATKLENTLFELRAQLNYILNYPKLEKYISLFPPSKEETERNPDLSEASQTPQSETDERRENLLRIIKQKMVTSELSGEPELDVEGIPASASASRAASSSQMTLGRPVKSGAPTPKEKKSRPETSKSEMVNLPREIDRVVDDNFFESDSHAESGLESDLE